MRHRLSRNVALLVLPTCFFLILLWLITHLSPDWFGFEISDILIVCLTTLFVLFATDRLKMTRTMKTLVRISYAARLLLALIASYGFGSFASFLNMVDNFYPVSVQYFYGDFSRHLTNYPRLLNAIYQVTGPDQIVAHIVNILLWLLGYFVIQAAVGDLYNARYKYYLFLYTFLPHQLLRSTQICREQVIILSLMLSFCFLLKWMQANRLWQLIAAALAAIPAIWMHMGNVAMLGVIGLVFAFWQPKKAEWKPLSLKIIMLAVAAVLLIPTFLNIFFHEESVFRALVGLTQKSFVVSRSDYIVTDMRYTGPLQFLGNTIYLMLYFWISPTPRFWNSPIDVLGAVVDTVPWFVFYYLYFKEMRRKDSDRRACAGMFVVLLFTFLYGWGTRNGGTAMRHRGQLLGMMTMAAMVAAKRPEPQKESAPELHCVCCAEER